MTKHIKKEHIDPVETALHALSLPASHEKAQALIAKVEVAETARVPEAQKVAQTFQMPRLQRRLGIPRLALSGYLHNTFDATAERGTTKDDLLDAHFWTNVAQGFKPMDHVKVTSEDGSWGAYLRVVACDRTWAKMHIESFHDYSEANQASPGMLRDNYDVRWTTLGKFAVIKKGTDGAPPLKENFQTEQEAHQWLSEYLRDMNR